MESEKADQPMKLLPPDTMMLRSGRVPVAVIGVSEAVREALCAIVSALPWKDSGQAWDIQGLLAEVAIVWWLRNEGIAVAGPVLYKGPPDRTPVDVVAWRKSHRRTDIGIRSREHRDLDYFGEVAYPAPRIESEDEKLPDYIVAASVDGSKVAIWGAIHRRDLIRATAGETPREGHPAFYTIPLDAFKPETLERLLKEADRAM